MTVRILLADDHKILRDGLRLLIQKEPDMEVVDEADNGRSAVELSRTLTPDVVIMDVRLPGLSGIDATRQIVTDNPDIMVVALSMHSDNQFVTGMFSAGARGYLLKDSAFEELAVAVRTTVSGQTYLSPEIASTVVNGFLNRAPTNSSNVAYVLTPREREVLTLVADGNNTRQVAEQLKVSAKTVETHRRNLMEKLSIHSIAELTKFAIREGLTTLEH